MCLQLGESPRAGQAETPPQALSCLPAALASGVQGKQGPTPFITLSCCDVFLLIDRGNMKDPPTKIFYQKFVPDLSGFIAFLRF